MTLNRNIDDAFKDALAGGVFPAADLLVAKSSGVIYEQHYGNARAHTCFDIASLTKPVCTATLAMMLVEEKLLTPEDTVYQWLAGAREAHHKLMTVKHLLDHKSGLPGWQPYYRELPESLIGTEAGKHMILDSCYAEPLISNPGEKTLYSDIGFIILGEMVEQAGNAPLDALFMQRIARPLGLADTFFVRQVGAPTAAQKKKQGGHLRFAPTEDCPWRGRVLHGEVHDQNAYALGGVAGHAGLFSTAADLHKFIAEFVKCYNGKGDLIPSELVKNLIGKKPLKSVADEFSFGWNRPSSRGSSSGHDFSANSIGHSGFTGTSIWIDLEKDFWIILLTNRIHPSTMNEKIKSFRPMIHDLIFEELIA